MSKVALVLGKMPDDCYKCILHNYEDNDRVGCFATGFTICTTERPDWCPLRPLPEKMPYATDYGAVATDYGVGYIRGWNDCLRAIEGSGE